MNKFFTLLFVSTILVSCSNTGKQENVKMSMPVQAPEGSQTEGINTPISSSSEDKEKTPSEEEIVSEYLEYLSLKKDFSGWRYALIYIDNDETPEMLIEGNSQADGCLVLSLQSGEIAEMQTYRVSFSYIEKKGLCGYDTYDQGETYSVYYELKDGKFNKFMDYYDYTNLAFVDEDESGSSNSSFTYRGQKEDANKFSDLYLTEYQNVGKVIKLDSISNWIKL